MTKRGVTLMVAGVLVAGCFAAPEPDPPNLVQPDKPLTEVFRVPAPVPAPPPDRQMWRVYDGRAGILGEGRRVADVDLRTGQVSWALDLPQEYALTAASGPHSGFSVGTGAVLLAGAPGVAGVAAVRLVGAGRPVWERRLPAGSQVVRVDEGLLAAACDRSGCDLTGIGITDGAPLWTRRVPEQVTLLDAGWYTTPTDLVQVVGESGRELTRIPYGAHRPETIVPNTYVAMAVSPPKAPECRVTILGVHESAVKWRYESGWHDPSAPLTDGCSYDPSAFVSVGSGLYLIPDPAGPVWLDNYFGTITPADVYPGERVLARDLSWVHGVGYLDRSFAVPSTGPRPAVPPGPVNGPPWALALGGATWVLRSGTGLAMYAPLHTRPAWSHPAATTAVAPYDDRLVYTDGTDLVGLGPATAS